MNKKSLILAASALAMVLSCNVREEFEPELQKVTFQAVMADVPPTKTVLQSDGSVFWSPGDAINLFYGDAVSEKMVYDSTATVAAQASFTGTLPTGFAPNGKDEFWAVYPYSKDNVFDGSSVTLTLPDLQPSVTGTFADDLFISLARSTGYELSFYNLCGGIKFSVTTPGITRVVFYGHQEEYLAGKVKVGFDENGKPLVQEVLEGSSRSIHQDAPSGGFEVGKWYYMVALPTTLARGYTMIFYKDGELVSERSVFTPVAIKRSIWGRITDADVVDNGEQPNNEIWYTSTDGEIVNPYDATVFGANIVSNTYVNGRGVIRFDGDVTSVGNSAFLWSGSGNARNLTSVYLPETVTLIGNSAFFQCSNLTEIKIPDAVTSIGYNAFLSCERLSSIDLPQSLTSIGQEAFLYCQALTSVDIPTSVTSIASGAFAGCANLESFTGKFASADGRALIVSNDMKAFAPAGLTTYTIPDGVTTVSNEVFRSLNSLEEVIFPEGILSLGGVFNYCSSLKTVTIPSTVISMYSAFLDASTVADALYVLPATPPQVSANNVPLFRDSNDFPIYVPANSLEAYKTATGWSDYADRILPMEDGTVSVSSYLTFSSRGTTTLSLNNNGAASPTLYYSSDAKTWTEWAFWDTPELTFTADAPLYLCGDNPDGFSSARDEYNSFVTSGDNFIVSGDIMSLLSKNGEVTAIPSGTLYCFNNLFKGCSNLISAPELPATTLAAYCYRYMFQDCTSLTSAPALPATVMSSGGYWGMFSGCTSLTEAPELPATTLNTQCYSYMFEHCSSLESAPALPATTLANDCYDRMFYDCTSLTSAPELPATEMQSTCYAQMFLSCTSLTNAPALPATTLAERCYAGMFWGCSSLTTAPELPAATLASGCYQRMFMQCSSLETAPDLLAATLPDNAYYQLFYGCSNLNYVRCLATDISATDCLTNWMSGVPSTGTFVKSGQMNDWPTGANGIPDGWTVEDAVSANKYLTFTSEGTSYITFSNTSDISPVLYYSTDATIWNRWDYSKLTFTQDKPLYICGDNPDGLSFSVNGDGRFNPSGSSCSVSGDIMSLLNKDADTFVIPTAYCFRSLFRACMNLVSAAGLELPATTLTDYCYSNMFMDCQALTTPPAVLPATTLAPNCYESMFNGCYSLRTPPELPATSLASGCYSYMFSTCSVLETAPSLPALTLSKSCYYYMFKYCTALTDAPALPATELAEDCYNCMFQDCSQLVNAPELPATTLANGCYSNMFSSCKSLTTAPALPATTLARSCYSGMFTSCSGLTSAPELPATALAPYCYSQMFAVCSSLTTAPVLPAESLADHCYNAMFNQCTSLNYVKCLAFDISAEGCTSFWLNNVSSTGTFVKQANSQWPEGTSGIPEGWTVENEL